MELYSVMCLDVLLVSVCYCVTSEINLEEMHFALPCGDSSWLAAPLLWDVDCM